jgi:hypothetical protein
MKTSPSFVTALIAAALFATVAGPTTSVFAEGKGAEQLVKSQQARVATAQVNRASAAAVTSCPKCKDVLATVAQPLGKGGRKATALVSQHQCPSCGTTIESVGVGKQATTSVKHVCKEVAAAGANCCSTAKAAH